MQNLYLHTVENCFQLNATLKFCLRFIQYCISQGSFSNGPGSGPSDKHFQMPEDADLTLAQKLAKLGINESSLFEDEGDLTGADYENRPWRSDEQ